EIAQGGGEDDEEQEVQEPLNDVIEQEPSPISRHRHTEFSKKEYMVNLRLTSHLWAIRPATDKENT
ncbi:MAG: hypothetical protein EB037_12370, partial [Actinobacteria bacterium]|nr:hypothetical protein [Actinomycetota bacterium]